MSIHVIHFNDRNGDLTDRAYFCRSTCMLDYMEVNELCDDNNCGTITLPDGRSATYGGWPCGEETDENVSCAHCGMHLWNGLETRQLISDAAEGDPGEQNEPERKVFFCTWDMIFRDWSTGEPLKDQIGYEGEVVVFGLGGQYMTPHGDHFITRLDKLSMCRTWKSVRSIKEEVRRQYHRRKYFSRDADGHTYFYNDVRCLCAVPTNSDGTPDFAIEPIPVCDFYEPLSPEELAEIKRNLS